MGAIRCVLPRYLILFFFFYIKKKKPMLSGSVLILFFKEFKSTIHKKSTKRHLAWVTSCTDQIAECSEHAADAKPVHCRQSVPTVADPAVLSREDFCTGLALN